MNLKLKQYRESKGLTQRQFAKLIEKSIGTIQSWEHGDSFPNAEAIWDMSVYFKTDPNNLLGWYEEHPSEKESSIDIFENELIDCYRSSTTTRKSGILQVARDSAAMSKEATERAPSESGERKAV